MTQKVLPSIQLILNDNKRLEDFKPLFEWFSKNNRGKLTSSHFVIDSNILLQARNPVEESFNYLQQQAASKGFSMTCFCLNIIPNNAN